MMYWAYPPPDDGALAEDLELTRQRMEKLAAQFPDRFQLKQPVKWPKRRKGSDDPLRLTVRKTDHRQSLPRKVSAAAYESNDPNTVLRDAIRRARRAGWSQADLAEYLGITERTLTRRLSAPETVSLGEYRKILQAANMKGTPS